VPDTDTTTPASTPATAGAWDRLVAALRRIGDSLAELIRRGNRRRVTLRGRDGTVWLRLPLTLAAVLALIALTSWLAVTALVVVALFALGVQLSVERQADPRAAPGAAPNDGTAPSGPA
jgi:hypothetical protein